ncbi:MAG: T9SS type A sorting domain-containing protein [Saprospiraceae bacterium]|nr:T9SS type A sorting domain-containing protein [Saprospiraceae bacterium]
MKRIVVWILFSLSFASSVEAQTWANQSFSRNGSFFITQSSMQAHDGNIIIVGHEYRFIESPLIIQKWQPDGRLLWEKIYPEFEFAFMTTSDSMTINKANDGGYIVSISGISFGHFTILKIDENGNKIWDKRYNNRFRTNAYQILPNKAQTGYAIFSDTLNMRINNVGEIIKIDTSKFYYKPQWSVNSKSNKDFWGIIRNSQDSRTYIAEINADSTFHYSATLWDERLGTESLQLSDGHYLVYGTDLDSPLIRNYHKISSTGQRIWDKRIVYTDADTSYRKAPFQYNIYANTHDGGFMQSYYPKNSGIQLIRYDSSGVIIWKKQPYIQYGWLYRCHSIFETPDSGFVVGTQLWHFKVNANGDLFTSQINGRIKRDTTNDCIAQANEPPIKGLVTVTATKEGGLYPYYDVVDSLGNYHIPIDTGLYSLKLNGIGTQLWQNCTPSVLHTVAQPYSVDTVDFALKPLVNCPAMRVNAGTWGLRRCFENTYSVHYFNDGTAIARNAFVEITIDSLMEFRRASIPLSSRVGQRLRFNVGDVAYGRGGRFDVTVYVKCEDSTRLNQTLCFEAHIFPDTICTPTTGWNGANIVVTGTCARDSVVFTVRNTGNAPTGNVRQVIIEDQVMFSARPISLPANGVLTEKLPANGATWRLTVEQVPNHPRSKFATAFVEGCRNNPTTPFSTGNANVFPEDDGDAAIDIQCLAIRGSYDPNDKAGYPLGTGTNRQIAQNQDIEYLIRFQNTGTDTAFQVVLRDTLPSQLDIGSIEPGASSHPYSWDLKGRGILIFNFDNIRLVDSFSNEPASHGFVKFRIRQKKDLPLGTLIENSAGIYFDYNAPIITRRTFHTVGKDILLTATVDPIFNENVKIEVFPNPFSQIIHFTILQSTPSVSSGIFELFDLNGTSLRREKFDNSRFEFYRKDLPTGIFVFKISATDGRLLGVGKVVAQ